MGRVCDGRTLGFTLPTGRPRLHSRSIPCVNACDLSSSPTATATGAVEPYITRLRSSRGMTPPQSPFRPAVSFFACRETKYHPAERAADDHDRDLVLAEMVQPHTESNQPDDDQDPYDHAERHE